MAPPEDRRSFSSVLSDFTKTLASGEMEVGVAQDQLTPAKRGRSAAKLLFCWVPNYIGESAFRAHSARRGRGMYGVLRTSLPQTKSRISCKVIGSWGHGTISHLLVDEAIAVPFHSLPFPTDPPR